MKSTRPFVCIWIVVLVAACAKDDDQARSAASKRASEPPAVSARSPVDTSPLLSVTGCRSTAIVLCFRDTTNSLVDPDAADPVIGARWLWFGGAGDSVQISTRPDISSHMREGAYLATSLGEELDSLRNTAPYFRRRLTEDGVIEMVLLFDSVVGDVVLGDTVAYTLRIRHDDPEPKPALVATGRMATLTIPGAGVRDEFSIVPLSMARSVHDLTRWKIHARTYRVALVADSLYQLCRLPCTSLDTIKLLPATHVTKVIRR
jgi:hypothetical protein